MDAKLSPMELIRQKKQAAEEKRLQEEKQQAEQLNQQRLVELQSQKQQLMQDLEKVRQERLLNLQEQRGFAKEMYGEDVDEATKAELRSDEELKDSVYGESLQSLAQIKAQEKTIKEQIASLDDQISQVSPESTVEEMQTVEEQIAEIESAAESAKEIPEYQLQQVESHGGNIAEIANELSAVDQEIEKTAEEGVESLQVEGDNKEGELQITQESTTLNPQAENSIELSVLDQEVIKEKINDSHSVIKTYYTFLKHFDKEELENALEGHSRKISKEEIQDFLESNNDYLSDRKNNIVSSIASIVQEKDPAIFEAALTLENDFMENNQGMSYDDFTVKNFGVSLNEVDKYKFSPKYRVYHLAKLILFESNNEDILETKKAEGIQEVQVEDSENIENKTGNTEKTEAEKTDSQIETIEKSGEVTPEEYAQSFEDQLQYLAKKEYQANRWIQEGNRQYKETQEEYKKFQEAGGSRVKHEQLFWTQANFDSRLNSIVRDGEHASEMIRSVKKAREDIDKSIKNFEQDKKQFLIKIGNAEQEIGAIEVNIKKSKEEIENAGKSYRAWMSSGSLGLEPVSPKAIAEKNSHLAYDLQKAKQELNYLQDNYNHKYVHGSRNDEKYRNSVYNAFLDKHQ